MQNFLNDMYHVPLISNLNKINLVSFCVPSDTTLRIRGWFNNSLSNKFQVEYTSKGHFYIKELLF